MVPDTPEVVPEMQDTPPCHLCVHQRKNGDLLLRSFLSPSSNEYYKIRDGNWRVTVPCFMGFLTYTRTFSV